MGTKIIVPNADFSARNKGNINRYYQLLQLMGTTSPTFQAAFKTFYNGFEAAGLPAKFYHAWCQGGGTSLADSIDIITGLDANRLTFMNDTSGSHTQAGFTASSATVRLAVTNFKPPQLSNFGMHVFHTTPIGSGLSGVLTGIDVNSGGVDYNAGIRRNSDGNWLIRIDAHNGNSDVTAGGPTYSATTGLKSGTITGGNLRKQYINGILRGNDTKVIAPVLGGVPTFAVGGTGLGPPIGATDVTLRFTGYSKVAWTQDDETTLNNLLEAFNTALA